MTHMLSPCSKVWQARSLPEASRRLGASPCRHLRCVVCGRVPPPPHTSSSEPSPSPNSPFPIRSSTSAQIGWTCWMFGNAQMWMQPLLCSWPQPHLLLHVANLHLRHLHVHVHLPRHCPIICWGWRLTVRNPVCTVQW